MNRIFMLILVAVVAVLAWSGVSLATTVNFVWDANPPEEQIDGYKLWEVTESGVTMQELQTITGAQTTSTSYEIPEESRCYYFVLTAYRGNLSSQPTAPPIEWCPKTEITVPVIVSPGVPTTVINIRMTVDQQ